MEPSMDHRPDATLRGADIRSTDRHRTHPRVGARHA